jgi:hypothetical protein
MPDPRKLLTTIRRATELSRSTPGRSGGIVAPPRADEVMVVGDLHGNLRALQKALQAAALDRHSGRHLVLQELIHGNLMYPDGQSDRSHQLLDVFAALKCQYPDRVHLILGNHELAELTGRVIGKDGEALNDKFRLGVSTAYGALADQIYESYKGLFAALPLAIRTANRVFVCHTIPDRDDLDALDLELLKADTWPDEAKERGGTIYAMTWGRDTAAETADRFAAMVDADWFITGHQPCEQGFHLANHRQIIIDGTDPYPAYCLLPTDQPMTIGLLLKCVRVIDVIEA